MRLSHLSFNGSTNKCITHRFVFVSSIKKQFFRFSKLAWRPSWIFPFWDISSARIAWDFFLWILGMSMNMNPLRNLPRRFCWTLALCLPYYISALKYVLQCCWLGSETCARVRLAQHYSSVLYQWRGPWCSGWSYLLWKVGDRAFEPNSGIQVLKKTKWLLPAHS